MKPTFFPTPAAFRRWLKKNHDSAAELWVGFYKKGSGKPSITWPESVDQALCFGWIDGLRKSVDEDSYMIRFTPRRRGSIWSVVNVKRAKELIAEGLMHSSGAQVFNNRDVRKTNRYAFEQARAELEPAMSKLFRANRKAWEFFQKQPPYYRKIMTWWVVSAKQPATRERRLLKLIEESAAGRRVESMGRGTGEQD